MNDLMIVVPIVIALSGALLWLLSPRRDASASKVSAFHSDMNEALPSPKHYKYFRQIRQALSAADTEYLIKSAPPRVAKRALHERRGIALGFLKGLREDFLDLARLGRIIAALSPELSRQQETERLLLTLKFQMLCALVWLRLSTGSIPIEQLGHLTDMVGSLAARMDEAVAQIAALSTGDQISRSLSA